MSKDEVLKSIFITVGMMFITLGVLTSVCFSLWLIIPCALCGLYIIAFILLNRGRWIFSD